MLRRTLLITVALAVVLCLLIVVVRTQQYAFRFRAERLENDIKSLQYGSTTFSQARPILQRWNATYDDGTCETAKCSAEITLGDFACARAEFFSRHQRLFRTYGILGGRPAFVGRLPQYRMAPFAASRTFSTSRCFRAKPWQSGSPHSVTV